MPCNRGAGRAGLQEENANDKFVCWGENLADEILWAFMHLEFRCSCSCNLICVSLAFLRWDSATCGMCCLLDCFDKIPLCSTRSSPIAIAVIAQLP